MPTPPDPSTPAGRRAIRRGLGLSARLFEALLLGRAPGPTARQVWRWEADGASTTRPVEILYHIARDRPDVLRSIHADVLAPLEERSRRHSAVRDT